MISREKLLQIISDALEIDANNLNLDTRLEDITEFDSLGALSVFSAISEITGGKSDDVELTEATSIKQIFELLEKEGLAS